MGRMLHRLLIILGCAALVVGCSPIQWPGKGAPRQPAATALPAGSGAGAEALSLAFAAPAPFLREGDLWLVPAAGGVPVRLTGHGRAWDPRLSPDGSAVAYVAAPAASGRPAELRVISLTTGEARTVAEGEGPWSAPAWSPEGARLAWAAGERLAIMSAAGGAPVREWTPASLSASREAPVWDADGTRIYAPLYAEGASSLWALPLVGDPRPLAPLDAAAPWALAAAPRGGVTLWHAATLRTLGATTPVPSLLSPGDGLPQALAWAPDGDALALLDTKGNVRIGSAAALPEGNGHRAAGATALAWAADGALLLWQSFGGSRDTAIQRLEVDDFPVVVINDTKGNDLYVEGANKYRR